MQEYLKAAKLSDIANGKCKAVELSGLQIVLVNVGGVCYALENSCSHLGAPLSEGFVSKTSITCEWHGASFNLKTGEAESAPAKEPIKSYELRVVGDDIEVLV